jgi:PAS domain S-box-containing protein
MHSILIVDDEQQVRTLLATFLETAGYLCRTAESVASAQEVLMESPFDLVLTDMDMPGASGVDLILYLKERYPQTAVVIVTVIDDPEQAREVLDLGIYGYVVKPFTRNLVLITVENALRHHHLEMQVQLHAKMLEREVAVRTKSLDEQVLFFQTLIDTIPVPVYYKDTDGIYLGCNRSFEAIVGLPRRTITGKTAAYVHAPELAGIIVEKDRELLRTGGVQRYETTVIYPNGLPHTGITHKATFTDSNGEISGLVGVRLDISELKATEYSLRLSEEKLRSIMDNLHIGVVLINMQMELIESNRQMRQWFPHISQISGKYCFEELCNEQQGRCQNCPAGETFDLGVARESTIKLQTREGERIFRVFFTPIHNESQKVTAVIGLYEDVTFKLAAERDLRQAQKLEAIGQLAAGIAHEINTPVQYVGDNIGFLGDSFVELGKVYGKFTELLQAVKSAKPALEIVQDLEELIECTDVSYLFEEIPGTIKQSKDGVNRVAEIVRAVRDFSHPGSEEKIHVDINRAIESTVTVSRNEWKYVADVETDLKADLPSLPCLPGEINQVLLNLIINAAHAIGDVTEGGSKGKGTIRLSTRVRDEFMEICIADTGGGIPETIQDRIFDPFFTTKEIGKGTGQGLAIAHNVIVDKHQGTLGFVVESGKGTTFIIRLPLH